MEIKTVLVTGGAGYVGAVLVPKLLKAGYHVSILDWYLYGSHVFAPYSKNKHLNEIKGDIRNNKVVLKSLKNIDAVIHLACISNDPSFELDPKLGKSVNFDATKTLIDQAKKTGVHRFVYASSSSVYGVKKEKRVTETVPLEPLTDYSKYKALSEDYLLKHNSDSFTTLILRPSTVCGYSPRLRLDLTVNMLTIQALVNKRITVFGGSQKRPNIHIEDITDLYVKTLQYSSRDISGKIYNAGYENYTVLHIAKIVKKVLRDPSIQIDILPSNDLRSYHVDSSKIKKDLDFKAKHSIEEAIMDLKKAYFLGKIVNPMKNDLYYNIKTMNRYVQKKVRV